MYRWPTSKREDSKHHGHQRNTNQGHPKIRLTSVRMSIVQKEAVASVGEDTGKGNTRVLLTGM